MKHVFTLLLFLTVWTITDAQIFVKHDAAGNNDGTSWTNAFTDLQDAIDAATTGEQIWIAAGTYKPTGPTPDSSHFLATHPVHLYGGFLGTETAVDQRDWETYQTIFSGDLLGNDVPGDFDNNRTDNAHHVLIINAPNTQSVIDGVVFVSGTSRLDVENFQTGPADMPYNRWSGGALYLYRSGAVIRNCVFHNNDSGVRGSGFYAFGDTLHTISLHIDNVIFRDNSGYNGAACFIHAFQDVKITNSQVIRNSGFQGGGLFFSGSNATVEHCVLDSNYASYGGAIMGFHANIYIKHPDVRIYKSTFTGNTATSRGGGVYFTNTYGAFSLSVDSCLFTGNSAENGYGGGIVIRDSQDALPDDPLTTVHITNSEFNANTAGIGGGVEIEAGDDSVKIVIENVQFQDNTGDQGGGLFVYSFAQAKVDFLIRNAEFIGNVAMVEGGMSIQASNSTFPLHYLLEDCLFAGNVGDLGIGALGMQSYPQPDKIMGTIRRTKFEDNHGVGAGGAIFAFHGNHAIEDSYFLANSTDATFDSIYHGGGAISITGPAEISINRSIFEANTSLTEGSAIAATDTVTSTIENTLFHHQEGNSTIYFDGDLNLMNTTMVENEGGLFLQHVSATEIQNSIFDNQGGNLSWDGEPTITSNGGNLSSDASMTSILTGSGIYNDLHGTDPLLGPDYVPLPGSPAIDAGNADGVTAQFDLAGNPRISGKAIDIGSYESLFSATKDAIWNSPGFTVFPNPVIETLNFDLDMDWIGEFNLIIYNYLGQQVYQTTMHKSDKQQAFQQQVNLTSGQYVLLIPTSEMTYAVNISIAR